MAYGFVVQECAQARKGAHARLNRQEFGGFRVCYAKPVTANGVENWSGMTRIDGEGSETRHVADGAGGGHRFERRIHHGRGAGALSGIAQLELHQLGVGENDAELIAELVKQAAQVIG